MGNRDFLGLLGNDFLDRFPRKPRNFAFQITHTRFTRVIANQVTNGAISYRPFIGLQAIRLTYLAHQMALGDFNLLIFRIAGDANDLHAVKQGLRHAKRIRGGHEHHIRKIIIHFQIVIREGAVLFRVQHFKQRRGRVTAPIRAQLVNFIKQEKRVGGLGLLHALKHLTGHGADIGPPMAADLRLIPHTAKRHTHKIPPRRLGDGFAERGLAHTRRAHQAQDRTTNFGRA